MFATHYHLLTDAFADVPEVSIDHMAYHVEDSGRDVTFLYKLEPGVCPKSYGLNCASKAGVPDSIVSHAEVVSQDFEAGVLPGTTSAAVASFRAIQTLLKGSEGAGAAVFASTARSLLAKLTIN